MAKFAVVIVTAAPAGQAGEAGGAFVKVDGREALLRSVELFLNRDNVVQIQVAFLPDALEEAKRKFGPHFGFSGVRLIGGGPRWLDQVAAGAEKLDADATHVVVHDAARPAVPYTDLDAVLDAAEKHPAVALATPLRSTLVEVDEGGSALAYHLPSRFMNLVTPQVFSREEYLRLAKEKTDTHASQVTLLKGSPLNVRVAGSGDASLIKAMLNMLPKPKKAAGGPFDEAQW